jgi:hypothetical protein
MPAPRYLDCVLPRQHRATQLCANLHVAECNWLVKVNPGRGAVAELCTSCKLTRARPNNADTAALAAFVAAEKAKRAAGGRTH